MGSSNLLSDWRGSRETLTGAILGFKAKKVLFSSLTLKECSSTQYKIRPSPNDGSITCGMYFSSIRLTIFCSNWTFSLLRAKVTAPTLISRCPSLSNCSFKTTLSFSVSLSTYASRVCVSFLYCFPRMPLLRVRVVCWVGLGSL